MNANSDRITAESIIERAEQIADIQNTDFLSYDELIKYLNDSFRNVYQTIIQYNLNVFTVEANLVGAGGIYPIPFDCYQIKSVKNPYTGVEIPRKADSESALGGNYEIVNNTIRLGPSVGPVTITYWRKPFFLTFPNKTIDTSAEFAEIIDFCKNSILGVHEGIFYIYNCLTDSKLEIESEELVYDSEYEYRLGNNFILENTGSEINVYSFTGVKLGTDIAASAFIRADNGLVYYGRTGTGENEIDIYLPLNSNKVSTFTMEDTDNDIIQIDGEFYEVPAGSVPFGIFDDRPAYIGYKTLNLINENGSIITEEVDLPIIGNIIYLQYGFLTFDGKLYSNIPDTYLDFPNNLYYDVISYDLAIRFLCKQNADSSGVENLNLNAWSQLTSSIDQSADYPRIKLVRR